MSLVGCLGLVVAGPAQAQDATTAGELTTPNPTLENVSIVWAVSGDDNHNGSVYRAHPYELERTAEVTLRVSYRQTGLGGDNSWGARPHPEFTLGAEQPYHFRFRLAPVSASRPAAMELGRQRFDR